MLLAKLCLVLAWAVLILALMTRPMPIVESDAKGFTVSDKLVHIFLFGVLMGLILDAWWLWRQRLSKLAYGVALGSALALAYFSEYCQQFIPGRSSSLYDLLFGFLGMLLASWFMTKYWLPRQTDKNKPTMLLHLCCGPCGSFISQELKNNYQLSLFFANSNVDSQAEFNKRLKASQQLAHEHGLKLIVEDYDHADWLELAKDLADEPERGRRCLLCYEYRLRQTATKAEALGFDFYTTSLSVSPYKDGQAVIHIGRQLSKQFKPKFFDKHFGQNKGFAKSVATAKRLKLYRQKYCGCEFSWHPKK